MRWWTVTGTVVAMATILVTATAASDADPWVGKTGDQVEHALGTPAKVKSARDGSETWTYRFLRLREGSPPSTRMVAVEVPDVGVLYRLLDERSEEHEFEPTAIDDEGRTVPGGVRSGVGGSATYDSERKRFERDWDPDDKVEIDGKVKLKLRLDASGRVVEWTVSPRSARLDARDS